MNKDDITGSRLFSQHIAKADFSTAEQVVSWMGAIQAQDYAGALWSIALRSNDLSLTDIEAAIERGEIVRTWPMRGTLHFVAAKDVRWMVKLLAPRATQKASTRRKSLGVTPEVIDRCIAILSDALKGKQYLSRSDILALFEAAGIQTSDQRGNHILRLLAELGFICFGPHIGKQPSFALFDDWVPKSPEPTRDEALKILVIRYFKSHGPATENDFANWAGLTLGDTRRGIEQVSSELQSTKINGKQVWFEVENIKNPQSSVFLLPGFDEYMLGYRDRSAALPSEYANHIVPGGNGMFLPTIIEHGQVIGTWRRNVKKSSIELAMTPFQELSLITQQAIQGASKRYEKFIQLPVTVRFL